MSTRDYLRNYQIYEEILWMKVVWLRGAYHDDIIDV